MPSDRPSTKPEAINRDLTLPGLVHDLNNVFQTLVDAADLLSSDPKWEKVSAAIFRSVERGRHIAASLADGKATSARFESVLSNAISFVEDCALSGTPSPVRFVSEVDPEIELRHGWAWERVLINLFLNACRAMPEGGTIHVRALRRGNGVEVAVGDDGTGIATELRERIFEPRISGHGSTGLGLHIVKSIVEQDGGTIRLANVNKGTEFLIHLPSTALIARRNRMVRAAGD